jgi:sugar diacid utilization regulator
MASLRRLLESPALQDRLSYLARPRTDPAVERVALVEDLGELDRVGAGAIVLLTLRASEAAGTYRFDMALRLARSRNVAALVLTGPAVGSITPTSAAIADRSGTAILGTGAGVDLAELALAIGRELAGGSDVALLRAHTAIRAIEVHPPGGRLETLLEHAGSALGVRLSMVDSEPASGPRAAIRVDDHVEAWLTAPPQTGDLALAVDLVLGAAAGAAGRALAASRRAEELPIRSREEVLTEMLFADPQARAQLVQRARKLDVPIDGWHVAVRLEVEDLAGESDGGQAAVALSRPVLQALRAAGGDWYSARSAMALVLCRIHREDPGIAAPGDVARAMDQTLARMRTRMGATIVRCGVGSAHPGAAGLLASVAEARAAVAAARTSGRVNVAVPFDSVGLRRTLVEWYASDTAQEAVATVLQPLSRLGGARAERLIQTLHVYLDQQGSLTKTAERLDLHRNAVAYRVNQIFDLLDVNPENPDDLLLLQLACRARELA